MIQITDTDHVIYQTTVEKASSRGGYMQDKRSLIEVLKGELQFLNRRGYRRPSWRPQFVFEDSTTCLNYGHGTDRKPCDDCVLMQLVPPEKRGERVPCRYIQLNEQGDTIASLYRFGTQDELESALRAWLTREIEKLEPAADRSKAPGTSQPRSREGDNFEMREPRLPQNV